MFHFRIKGSNGSRTHRMSFSRESIMPAGSSLGRYWTEPGTPISSIRVYAGEALELIAVALRDGATVEAWED